MEIFMIMIVVKLLIHIMILEVLVLLIHFMKKNLDKLNKI